MSFKDAVAAELQQISSRLLELHEQAIAQVRLECICTKDTPELFMQKTNSINIISVRPPSPCGDECESLLLAMPAVEAGEVKAKGEETSANEEAPLNCQVSDTGEEILELPGLVSAESLLGEMTVEKKYAVVRIDCAYNLRDADNMLGQGTSDPYCIVKLIGESAAREFRTRTISNTLNPVWNHAEELALDERASEYILDFVVMDEDLGKSDDLLGRARLALASCYPGGFNSCLALDEFGEAQLQVSIEFVSDDSEQVAKLMARSREEWMVDDQQMLDAHSRRQSMKKPSMLQSPHYLITGPGVLDQFVIAPTATIRLAWDVLSLCFMLFDAFTIPAQFAFDVKQTSGMLILVCIVTVYWTIDIVANFFTGVTEHGVVETRFRSVARKYMKGWFLIDILVVLADWVFITVEFGARSVLSPGNKLVKASRAAKAIKLLSLIRARKLSIYMPEISRQYSEVLVIFSHIVERLMSIIILTHCICCIWYGIGVADGETITWVRQRGIESKSMIDRYVISLDWALAQFTPSPTDTHPQNLRERIFKVCVDFCGLVTFSAFVSTITSRMSQLRVLNRHRIEKKNLLWRYFAENRVPINLSRRVLKVIDAREQEQASLQTCEHDLAVLQDLPERLLQELRLQVKMPHCLAHPFFEFLHACDALALYEACHKYIRDGVVLGGHELFLRGVQAEHMTFITKGCILYRCRGTSVNVGQGGWLSEASIWISGWVHRGDALASKLGQIMTLDAVQFQGLMMSRLTWPDLYAGGAEKFIKAYVKSFIADGEAALRGTKMHLSCSDVWSDAKQLGTHCSNAFKASGHRATCSRSRVSDYLRKQAVSISNSRTSSDFDPAASAHALSLLR